MDANTAAQILGSKLGYQVKHVQESSLPDIWEVFTDRSLVYLTEDGTP